MSEIENNLYTNGIPEWFAGKNILISGSTGFMGKVLVEKLLRDCPDLKQLYLLIRSKRGVDPEKRRDDYFKCEVFQRLLENNNNSKIFNKIKLIKGDILETELGLDELDHNELIENVDIVIHCAANVRFDQPLKQIIEMNLGGTEKMLKLAEKIRNLKVFTHVSTSYSHCKEDVLEEREYEIDHDPLEILEMCRSLDNDVLNRMTPGLLDGLPNTYAFSKAVTEALICRYAKRLPIVVCRPSIVVAALKEPMPGWVEGVNGPTGLMVGGARGVIRTMLCNPDYPATSIPVDTAINGIIAATWDRGQIKVDEAEFYNLVVSNKYCITWGESIECGRRILNEFPLSFAIWYPAGNITQNRFIHNLKVMLFHYLPAFFIDFILRCLFLKPFLVNIQRKISMGLEMLQYYTMKTWVFKNERLEKLQLKLNSRDQEKFECFLDQVCWENFIRSYMLGIRRYILKEPMDNIPKCKKIHRALYALHIIAQIAFYILLFWLLWNNIDRLCNTIFGFNISSIKFYGKQQRMIKEGGGGGGFSSI
ncbi:putative fatty acyl-CoA reductase CG5065 [Condylostylus longicornis]|uniref:putative fatty acyl-CoA reductase CG5065 n=1 Tax=Condylostylus longicornis TaxID=2530218 RepID=UPI00244DFF97|nr:putative fatty acyl-CoA reductase CG5065 [Condylostylus longicornis]